MWFNSSHQHQFAFDGVAAAYDAARTAFDADLVATLADQADLYPGDRVYEVGAGTGQLTRGLLEFGFEVTANEPGANMRAKLAELGELELRGELFEDDRIEPSSYDALFAANSFHWIRPEVAFRKAAALLVPGGAMCLLWNFAFIDPELQTELNTRAYPDHDDLVQDPAIGLDVYEGLMAAGRQLIAGSGLFEAPEPSWHPVERVLAPELYAELAVSYASTAALGDARRAELQQRILAVLDGQPVTITDHVYACIARSRQSLPSASMTAITDRASASVA